MIRAALLAVHALDLDVAAGLTERFALRPLQVRDGRGAVAFCALRGTPNEMWIGLLIRPHHPLRRRLPGMLQLSRAPMLLLERVRHGEAGGRVEVPLGTPDHVVSAWHGDELAFGLRCPDRRGGRVWARSRSIYAMESDRLVRRSLRLEGRARARPGTGTLLELGEHPTVQSLKRGRVSTRPLVSWVVSDAVWSLT